MRKYTKALSVCLLFALSGCDSQRLKQFSDLAAAGTAFAAAESVLTTELGTADLNADSTTLARAKEQGTEVTSAQLSQSLRAANADVKKYLTTLSLMGQQSAVLGAYFGKMSQLANSKNPDAIVTSANLLLAQIKGLNNSLATTLGVTETINNDVTPLVIAHFQVRALDKDLQDHADTVNKALKIHQLAVNAMASQLQQNLSTIAAYTESERVTAPYTSTSPLKNPDTWIQDRATIIRTQADLEKAQAAKDAIRKLLTSYQDVVSNKGAVVNFTDLLNSITQMAGFVSDVKTALNANSVSKQ